MIMLISVTPMIRAMESPALLVREKRIQFRRIALYHIGTDVAGAVVTAVAALMLRSVWALAISHVVSAVIATAISFALAPSRPRFRLVREPLRTALRFGKPLILASVLHFVAGRFDNFIVARQLGAQVLGTYVAAMRLIEIPVALVSYEIGRVLLPYYVASSQRSPEALSAAFVRSARYLCWGALAIYTPLALYAHFAVWLIFGNGWEAAVLPVRILAISGLLRTGGRAIGTLFKAMLMPGFDARGMAVEVGVLIVAVLVAVPLAGTIGAAWSVVVSFAAGFAFRLYALRSHFSMTSRDAFTAIAKPIAGTVIASLAAGVAQVAVGVDLLSLTAFALAFLGAGWTLEPEVRILVARLFPRSMPS